MTPSSLTGLSEAQRETALERFQIVRLFLEEGIPLARVARERGIILRTLQRWVVRYRPEGLRGLARKERTARAQRQLSDTFRPVIEGLALKKPPLSAASIHRQIVTLAEQLGE